MAARFIGFHQAHTHAIKPSDRLTPECTCSTVCVTHEGQLGVVVFTSLFRKTHEREAKYTHTCRHKHTYSDVHNIQQHSYTLKNIENQSDVHMCIYEIVQEKHLLPPVTRKRAWVCCCLVQALSILGMHAHEWVSGSSIYRAQCHTLTHTFSAAMWLDKISWKHRKLLTLFYHYAVDCGLCPCPGVCVCVCVVYER